MIISLNFSSFYCNSVEFFQGLITFDKNTLNKTKWCSSVYIRSTLIYVLYTKYYCASYILDCVDFDSVEKWLNIICPIRNKPLNSIRNRVFQTNVVFMMGQQWPLFSHQIFAFGIQTSIVGFISRLRNHSVTTSDHISVQSRKYVT